MWWTSKDTDHEDLSFLIFDCLTKALDVFFAFLTKLLASTLKKVFKIQGTRVWYGFEVHEYAIKSDRGECLSISETELVKIDLGEDNLRNIENSGLFLMKANAQYA